MPPEPATPAGMAGVAFPAMGTRATGGVYDPSMAHQLARLGYDRSFERVPASSPRRAPAGPGGGWRGVRLDPAARLVTLPPRVGVDLGGIAKGRAVDAAVERLSAAGLGPVMVNAGGDLRVQGRPPGGGDWWIEIDGPAPEAGSRWPPGPWPPPGSPGGAGRRRASAATTSSTRTGAPAWTGLWSVTAVAGSCAEAEVAAKAAFVLGRGPGTRFLDAQGLAGLDAGGGMLTWIVARAAGFTAHGLLTGSVVLGLALGLRWRSPRWPRWATTELHRFVTLLTLVFLGLHVLLLALDGYMRFRPVELLVPFANHYRPLWTGLGVVAAWLALAVWASTWLQG